MKITTKFMIGLMLLMMMFLVAPIVLGVNVTLVSPTNASFQNHSTVTYRFNITGGNVSSYTCSLYTNENGSSSTNSWDIHEITTASNNSETTFTANQGVRTSASYEYNWSVFCNASLDQDGAWAMAYETATGLLSYQGFNLNASFGVDSTPPVITQHVDNPTSFAWLRDSNLTVGLLVVDNNTDVCVLNSTIDSSGNTSQDWIVESMANYTSGTYFNFTGFNTGDLGLADDGSGVYKFSYWCNDSAGNRAYQSASTVVLIDSLQPSAFIAPIDRFFTSPGLTQLPNRTTASDFTPQIEWNITSEANFSRYEINFFTDEALTTIGVQKNITNISQNVTNMTSLLPDTTYFFQVRAVDLAGNDRNMSSWMHVYNTTSVCHNLSVGWNICGNLGNNKTLGEYLNDSGGSVVSYLNDSREFVSHVSAGSNTAEVVPSGQAVFIYMTSADIFQSSVWNLTALDQQTVLRNESNTDWNIMVYLNWTYATTFQQIDYRLNSHNYTSITDDLNVTFMSFYNNTADNGSKYIPFVGNLSINNATRIKFGDVIWAFLGRYEVASYTVTWDNVTGTVE